MTGLEQRIMQALVDSLVAVLADTERQLPVAVSADTRVLRQTARNTLVRAVAYIEGQT